MVVPGDRSHRYVVHDHDSIYPGGVDRAIAAMELTVVKTPVRAPQANAFCERLIGTIRRECLDFVIPLNERHVRHVLRAWVAHYKSRSPAHQPWARAFPTRRAIASRRCPVAIRFVIVIARRGTGSRRNAPRVSSRADGRMTRLAPLVSFRRESNCAWLRLGRSL